MSFAGIDVVPQLQYTRSRVEGIDDIAGATSTFAADGGVSERLRAGVGLSRTFAGGAVTWTPFGSLNAVHEFDGEDRYTIDGLHDGATRTDGTSALVEVGLGAQLHGWSLTAGASWADGGAVDGQTGGRVTLRYTW